MRICKCFGFRGEEGGFAEAFEFAEAAEVVAAFAAEDGVEVVVSGAVDGAGDGEVHFLLVVAVGGEEDVSVVLAADEGGLDALGAFDEPA
ncbi:MAG: hypothetical protein SFV54_07335, partial [Bryobacteraceae bacterium]|nr:hypothetical protein [Bryobacteraceae bacterium]